MKYSELLYKHYREKIKETWDWDGLAQSCGENPQWDDDGMIVGRAGLGSVISILPSGKVYAQWTTNQTVQDVFRDQAFMRALESVAENHGLFIEEFSDELFAACIVEDGQDAFFWRDRDSFFASGWYQGGKQAARNFVELEEHRRTSGCFSGLYTESCHGNLSHVTDPEKLDGYEEDDELPDLDTFARAYVECALLPLGDYDLEDLSISAVWQVYRDCRDFRILALDVYFEAVLQPEVTEEQVGRGFWLTRNRHGAGFWARPDVYGREVSEKLTEFAQTFDEQHAYVNDESEVEIE